MKTVLKFYILKLRLLKRDINNTSNSQIYRHNRLITKGLFPNGNSLLKSKGLYLSQLPIKYVGDYILMYTQVHDLEIKYLLFTFIIPKINIFLLELPVNN